VAILASTDWGLILDQQAWADQIDPLTHYGLCAALNDVPWLDNHRRPGRLQAHLTAWVASRLRLFWWCRADGHTDDDGWHGDDVESPCEWESVWAVSEDPDGFFRLAAAILRGRWWEPPPSDVFLGLGRVTSMVVER